MLPPGITLWAATASSACQDSQGSITLENYTQNIISTIWQKSDISYHIYDNISTRKDWIGERFQCRDSSWINLDVNAEAGGCVPINGIHNT